MEFFLLMWGNIRDLLKSLLYSGKIVFGETIIWFLRFCNLLISFCLDVAPMRHMSNLLFPYQQGCYSCGAASHVGEMGAECYCKENSTPWIKTEWYPHSLSYSSLPYFLLIVFLKCHSIQRVWAQNAVSQGVHQKK